MKTKRTDCHRPGAIEPRDYEYVMSYSLATTVNGWPIPSVGVNCVLDYRTDAKLGVHGTGDCCVIGMREHGRRFVATGGLGCCSICGASFVYGDVWLHVPSGEHLHVGHNCADKYQMLANRGDWQAANGLAREASARKAAAAVKAEERERFLAGFLGLREALEVKHEIVADIAARFVRYGSMTEPQVKLVMKLADEARTPRPEEAHVPAPEGKVTFRGTVVATKVYDDDWGESIKMTVKVQESGGCWLAWGTAPSSMLSAVLNNGGLRGHAVEVTATLRRGRDAHFALMSRPRGVVLDAVKNEAGGGAA